jgi:ATP-dependent DNA helicase RecQ
MTAIDILKKTYGYDGFRGQQEAIIAHVTAGGHAFVLMPTGGGKSLCYQIPALCRDGVFRP